MAAAPPSDQLGALQWFAPPLLHVYPAPAQFFLDLKTRRYLSGCSSVLVEHCRHPNDWFGPGG